jgi:hypothetical protein
LGFIIIGERALSSAAAAASSSSSSSLDAAAANEVRFEEVRGSILGRGDAELVVLLLRSHGVAGVRGERGEAVPATKANSSPPPPT